MEGLKGQMSQIAELEKYLEAGHGITPLGALEMFGCLSLSQRISELRQEGKQFEEKWLKIGGKRIKQLFLVGGNTHLCAGGCGKELQIQWRLCDPCQIEATNRPENVPGKGDAYEIG